MEKFICFGCWNNLNVGKGNLEKVTNTLKSYIANESSEDKTEFIIVAGDNYYPDKHTEPKKYKLIYPTKLEAGFDMLPKDIPIYMIMGNHDYDTNHAKKLLYVNDTATEEAGNCLITQLQVNKSKSIANIELNLFKSIYSADTQTLILMIDTSIYSSDAEEFLKCYNTLLPTTAFSSVSELETYQNRLILDAVQSNLQHINKIIIVGHHPITGFKFKIKEKNGVKEGDMNLMDDIPNFIPILEQINHPNIKYYYLCADYHSYQHGYITLSNGMRIEQYIAGTGGTELDLDLPTNNELTKSNARFTYDMPAGGNVRNWGFLVCHTNTSNFTCEPVFIDVGVGGKKTKRTKKNKKQRTRRRMQRK